MKGGIYHITDDRAAFHPKIIEIIEEKKKPSFSTSKVLINVLAKFGDMISPQLIQKVKNDLQSNRFQPKNKDCLLNRFFTN